MIDYREANPGDFSRIAQLSAESFGNYPYFDCVFRRAFKDDDSYSAYMERLHRVNIKANAPQNKCFVGIQEGKIVSAALLQDPSKKKAAVEDYVKAGGLGLVFPVGFSKILNFFHFSEDARADCDHKHPSAWYLEVLAVDKSMKGCGLGSSMIQDCLIPYVQQQGGRELTLITNTEGNRRFYQKNGFREFAARMLEQNGETIGNWSFCMDLQKDPALGTA